MQGVRARGGGDAPEDVVGGLEKALEQDWTKGKSTTKVAVMVADCPCHGKKYHNYHDYGDTYPNGDP
jgi:hypothetical protein